MELSNYISPLMRWWWLIVLSVVLAGASSYYVVSQQPDQYFASTTLMVGQSAINDPNPNSNQFSLAEQLAEIYADIASRDQVKAETMKALGMDWFPEYYANAIPQTQLIEVAVLDSDPQRAQIIANELAFQLIRLSPSNVSDEEQVRQDFIVNQLDLLQVQIEATIEEILVKSEELGEQFSAREIANIRNEIAALESKRNTLQNNYASLLASTEKGDINAITVIEPAALPTWPQDTGRNMAVITAMAVAAVLAASVAFLIEYIDDTVKPQDDSSQLFGLPKLVSLPVLDFLKGEDPLITVRSPLSPTSETFRSLRTSIQFANLDRMNRSLLVVSPNQSEGKSFIAANIAVIWAKAGNRVLLMDGDLRRPTQHSIFNLDRANGLSTMLLDYHHQENADFQEFVKPFVQNSLVPGLDIIVSGPIPPSPAELIGSKKMADITEKLLEIYDYIVIDAPSVLAVTDPTILSSWADTTILVALVNKTRRQQVKETINRLNRVNANLIGIVFNGDKEQTHQVAYVETNSSQTLDTVVTDFDLDEATIEDDEPDWINQL
ncbi:MAG: polysaccharide biosynthesis tyrosine autokinase [Anaerolineae bacterium]